MKHLSLLSCIAVLSFSVTLNAQNGTEDFTQEINQHEIFRQSNSLTNDVFDDYEYDNSFGTYRFLPSSQSLRYNRVDALFVGLGTDFADPHSEIVNIGGLDFDGFLGYSTGQRDWQYKASVSKLFGNSFLVGGELVNTSTTDDFWRTGLSENSITSLVAGYDYHDYYNAEGYGIYSELNLGRLISVGGSYNYTLYNSLNNNTGYSFFNGGNFERINPSLDATSDAITQESFGVRLALNKKGYTRGTFTSKFLVEAELSDVGAFTNDFSYNKFEVTSLNYLKLDNNTLLKVRMMAGSITGVAPDFKNFALGGVGSLRATGYKFYKGNKMFLSNTEVIFGDFWDFDRGNLEIDGLYLSLFLDSGWTDFVTSNSKDPFTGFESFGFSELAHNIGAGIGTGFIRFEIATPVVGSEGFTSFWVRLNPTF
ncbi:MAG: hypothetical protein JXR20_07460 [Balneola sp.]